MTIEVFQFDERTDDDQISTLNVDQFTFSSDLSVVESCERVEQAGKQSDLFAKLG